MLSYRAMIAMIGSWAIGALVLLSAGGRVAHAAPSTVAVLGIEPADVPDALVQQLTDALRKSVRGVTGLKQVQGKDLLEMKMVFGCDTDAPSCIAQAGRSLGADVLVIGIARKAARPTDLEVQLRLIDVKQGTQTATLQDVVSRSDVGARAEAWLGKLFGVAAPAPVPNPTSLYVGSVPSGATVILDGTVVGKTPLDLTTATPGRHSIKLQHAGYEAVTSSLDLPAGKRTPVEFRLTKVEAPPPTSLPTPVTPREDPITTYTQQSKAIPGVRTARAVTGVGIAALIVGGVLGGTAIWTWYSYTNIENDLSDRVGLLVPNRQTTAAESTWLQKPNCSPPSSLAEFGNTAAFASDCKHGKSLANTTTALVTTATIFGVGGLAAIIAGWQLEQKARRKADRTTLLLVPNLAPGYVGGSVAGRF